MCSATFSPASMHGGMTFDPHSPDYYPDYYPVFLIGDEVSEVLRSGTFYFIDSLIDQSCALQALQGPCHALSCLVRSYLIPEFIGPHFFEPVGCTGIELCCKSAQLKANQTSLQES